MTNFFDLFAGTSIGGILALSLVYPDPSNPTKPLYYSDTAMNLLYTKGE